jgi:hypothetical protein
MVTEVILVIVAIYLVCGLLFAIPFVIKGVTDIDAGALGSSIGFRIIIIPGVTIFWPWLLKKWIQSKPHHYDEAA